MKKIGVAEQPSCPQCGEMKVVFFCSILQQARSVDLFLLRIYEGLGDSQAVNITG